MPSTMSAIRCSSRTSQKLIRTRERTGSRLNRLPPYSGSMASAIVTSAPSSTSRIASVEPMKPAPPVTRARLPRKRASPAAAVTPSVAAPRSARAPVLEHVAQRLLEGDGGVPPGGLHEFRMVAEEDRHVAGAEPRRVLAHLDLRLGHPEQQVEHLADAPGAPAAQVVDLAALALLERQPVAAHDVAHVGEVALGLEVADRQHRRLAALLDVGDLLGEVRGHEHRPAPRPLVVEPAGAHAVHLPRHPVLVAEQVLG